MGYLLGVLAVVVGVPLSIALHEIGHLVPAKRFGIKCTQYMVGFGRTIWSRRIGETEYGLKAVPLGGYVRMIGMYPPRRDAGNAAGAGRQGRWGSLIEQARAEARAEVGPGDEGRQFYQRPIWQRMIVMLGGPSMNLVLAVLLMGGVVVGYGLPEETTTVGSVSKCVLPVNAPDGATCSAKDRVAPAAQAGLLPGDRIVSFAGARISDWSQVRTLIRSHAGSPVPVVVRRDGREVALTITPVKDRRYVLDADGRPVKGSDGTYLTEETGFAGIGPRVETVPQPVSEVPGLVWSQIAAAAGVIVNVPEKMVGVAKAIVGIAPRDPESPVSVVGVGRAAGEVASGEGISAGSSVSSRIASLVLLLGGLNLALFVINLVPLLPLDGGHVAGALWEGVRRTAARVLRRPDPGPVDTVRALPLIYAVATVLFGMGAMLIIADLVSPVPLSGG
jgi:membrane-associated protease RseP (regulator of RpoE activity)